MPDINENDEYEEVISSYYEGRGVSSVILLNVNTTEADNIAEELSNYDNLEDLFLVTGDVDMILKARFKDYDHMKSFLLEEVAKLKGVQDVQSMMIITTYKERGQKIEIEKKKKEEIEE